MIAWQLTQSTSTDETKDLLLSLVEILQKNRAQFTAVYVDNCCTVRNKLQEYFGKNIFIQLDIFHAVQRITRVLSKRHPLYTRMIKDIKLLFRDSKDTGKDRTLPTPTSDILSQHLDAFITKWKGTELQGSYILNDKAKKELKSLRVHIEQGCLSNIPPQAGTNSNENLHRCINPFFRRCRMGIPLAVALLTILFHHHNQKSGAVPSILSARASYKHDCSGTQDHHARFGILKKTQTPYINSWIFGPRLHGSLPQVNPNEITEVHLSPDIEHIASIHDIFVTLQSAIHLHQLSRSLYEVSNHSPLLNQKMIPFMSSVSCLFESDDSAVSEYEQHQKRLTDIGSLGAFSYILFQEMAIVAFLPLLLPYMHNGKILLPQLIVDLSIASIDDIAYQLRRMAVDEWTKNVDEYQHFLDGEHAVTEEAPMFLQQGHFFGPLGNTMVLAISNALGLPIIIFSSASHYPIINIAPRVCRASLPLYVAFNQTGAGRYDAVSFKSYTPTPSDISPPPQQPEGKTKTSRCSCGKHYSTAERCTIMQFKYTASIRCPCLLAGHRCTSLCACRNCANPKGTRPNVTTTVKEQRKKHAWSLKSTKSILYAHQEQENIFTRPPYSTRILSCVTNTNILSAISDRHMCTHCARDLLVMSRARSGTRHISATRPKDN